MRLFVCIIALVSGILLAGCPLKPDGEWDNSLQLKNYSNEDIFIQVVSKTRPTEFDFRFGCEAKDEVVLALPGTNRWKSMMATENGIVLNIFADSDYDESQQDLAEQTPLKQWIISDWDSVQSMRGTFEYP